MIHGREQELVRKQVEQLALGCGLEGVRRDVLFSLRRFKQRGAVYEGCRNAARQEEAGI